MAGSSITNPRKSGSLPRLAGYKQIQNVAGTGGVGQGSGAPLPRTGQPAPGMLRGTNSPTQSPTAAIERRQAAATRPIKGMMAGGYTATQANPPMMKPSSKTTAGSGMVRAQGEKRGGDRTGVEVVGAGGTPIRVDRNQEIAGAATEAQARDVRTWEPNSVYFKNLPQPAEPAAATSPVDVNGNIIKPNLPTEPSQTAQNQQILSGNFTSLSNPLQSNRINPPVTGTLPSATPSGDGGSDIATSGAGLSPTGTSQQPLTSSTGTSQQPLTSSTGTSQQPLTSSTGTNSTGESLPNPGGMWGPVWDKLSDDQKRAVSGAKEQARYDEYIPNSYDNNAREGSGLSRFAGAKTEDVLHTANEVAAAYNISPEKARYLLDKKYIFWSDGGRIETPSGTTYTGTEIPAMFSDNETVQGNAQEGADDLGLFEKAKTTKKAEEDLDKLKDIQAQDRKNVEELLNKPTDVSGVTSAFDKTIDATRQAAARNKALALRGLQERGAYSGASVNQMMGQSTEAGYVYDTEAQQQEAMLNLQKEMAIANAEKEDADRKLNWAVALYQSSSTKAEADANWLKVQKWQDISNAAADRRARAEAEANSPGIGAYLAAGGIGVAGALGSIFSGGATGVAALGAISSVLGSAGAMYGMANGSNVQMPATNFNYQSAPGSSGQSFSPIAGAPGSRDTYGRSATGNGSVRLGF